MKTNTRRPNSRKTSKSQLPGTDHGADKKQPEPLKPDGEIKDSKPKNAIPARKNMPRTRAEIAEQQAIERWNNLVSEILSGATQFTTPDEAGK